MKIYLLYDFGLLFIQVLKSKSINIKIKYI